MTENRALFDDIFFFIHNIKMNFDIIDEKKDRESRVRVKTMF